MGQFDFRDDEGTTHWHERVQCFRAPADTDDWPVVLAPRGPRDAGVDLVGDWISKHGDPALKYAGPVFEQFIRRAADILRDGSRPALLGLFERVALYLLRPDAGLVPPPPAPARRYAGSVRQVLASASDDDGA